ncbi:MAG: hypothetical protein NW216_10780 [Hyphomicrobium sp.]|nr:hypothetical protein [Hyphomicrobium sp.]
MTTPNLLSGETAFSLSNAPLDGSQGEFWALSGATTAAWVAAGEPVVQKSAVLASVGFPNIPPNGYAFPHPVIILDGGFVVRPGTGSTWGDGTQFSITEPEITVSGSRTIVVWAETDYVSGGGDVAIPVRGYVKPHDASPGFFIDIGGWTGSSIANGTLHIETLTSQKSVVVYINPSVTGGVLEYRMLDAAGNPLGLAPASVPGAAAGGDQTSLGQPRVVPTADGGFAITYFEASVSGGDGTKIKAQKFDADGAAVGAELSLVEPINLSGYDIVELADGGFAVAFQGYTGVGGPNDELFVQLFNANFEAVGDRIAIDVSQIVGVDQPVSGSDPSIAALTNGGFVVSWTANFGGARGLDVVAQTFRSDGAEIGERFAINTTSGNNQQDVDIVDTGGDTFLAAWHGTVNLPTAGDNPFAAASARYSAASLLFGTADIMGRRDLNDNLTGGVDNDVIRGFGGHDRLDGDLGQDLMYGGKGNDTFVVDNPSDQVSENSGEGIDAVESAIEWALGLNVENLKLTGSAAIAGTGNDLDNLLDGHTNSAANTLTGHDGDDTYVVDSVDVVVEGAGEGRDRIQTTAATYSIAGLVNVEDLQFIGSAFFTGTGNAGANRIIAGGGGSALDGGEGNDDLVGGAGNDALQGGADRDILEGANGNDLLNGGAGGDVLFGGSGDDTYVVDSLEDAVFEDAGNNGTDTVRTTLSTFDLDGFYSFTDRDGILEFWQPTAVERLEYWGGGSFTGTGNALANRISSGGGNDRLDGGAGADTLLGGLGNDTYVIDRATDVVTDTGGTDSIGTKLRVTALTSYAGIENLAYLGDYRDPVTLFAVTPELRGNSGNNRLTGGANGDKLFAGTGVDTLFGGEGSDTYVLGAEIDDIIAENGTTFLNGNFDEIQTSRSAFTLAGRPTIEALRFTGTGGTSLTGNSAGNTLYGGAGNDRLDGAGSPFGDVMFGGAGNDTYVVRNDDDTVSERSLINGLNTGGIDTIQTTVGIQLGDFIENATYIGNYGGSPTGIWFVFGNNLNNVIVGGRQKDSISGAAGNDVLNGMGGIDDMNGGAGNDTYFVEHAQDKALENTDDGLADIVFSTVGYTLLQGIENGTLTGAANVSLTGTNEKNVLTGNAGANLIVGGPIAGVRVADTLNGMLGRDTLTGGLGQDIVIFNTALGPANVDTITDFAAVDDTIRLENSGIFSALGAALGPLAAAKFWASASGLAHDADDRILYNTTTGALLYDADGNGRGSAVQFAILSNRAVISSADFVVI